MKLKLSLLTTCFILAVALNARAQKFSIPLEGFSNKKTTYLHMEDGSVMKGNLYGTGFKRSKGLVELVKMKDASGTKMKVEPSKIVYMYLPPSGLAKLDAAMEQVGSMNNWDKNTNYDTTLLKDDYVYFEKSPTVVKKKTQQLMLQMLNPSFSNKIKVYHDPFAGETMSAGVGGITVAGGLDKSYYVKRESDKAAWRLFKKNYKEEFPKLFADQPEFVKKYQQDLKWRDLEKHIWEYSQL